MSKSTEHDPLAWIQQGREERPARKAAKPKAKAKAKPEPKVKATKKK